MKRKRCKFCGANCNHAINIEDCLCCTSRIEKLKRKTKLDEKDYKEMMSILLKAHSYHLSKQTYFP